MKIIEGETKVFPVTEGITANRKDKDEVFPIPEGIPHPQEITTKKELTTIKGIAPTQDIMEDQMRDRDMTKEEAVHTQEDLVTDLSTTEEVT